MSTSADDFLTWATDPSRTLEERFGILRLVEAVYPRYYTGPDKQMTNYEAQRLEREDRRYNAAYEPVIDADKLRITADLLPKVTELAFHNFNSDRCLRDLSFLRFVPGVTRLTLEGLELESLDILRHLPHLTYFRMIHADRVEDYTALASCRKLQHISLYTQHPWPDFTGLETLPLLDTLEAHISLRAFIEIPALPAMRWLHLEDHGGYSMSGCLRDFHQLPDMPLLERLYIRSLYRLDGIERFPRLRAASIMGFFRTLAPVARAATLTHLRIANDELQDIAAVAAMPAIHHFALRSIRPQDWTPLMDSGTLREVFTDGCATPQPDFDTLQIVLPSRSDLFSPPSPRPLPPLRLLSYYPQEKDPARCPPRDLYPATGPAGWDGCHFMRQSESWWLADLLEEAFRAAGLRDLPGLRLNGFSTLDRSAALFHGVPSVSSRHSTIRLLRPEAISRLRDAVAAIRTALSQTLHSSHVTLILDAEPDADDWDDDWRDGDDTPQERAMEHIRGEQEREREQQRLQLFLADQHRLALLKEEGAPPTPGDIGPRRLPPAKPLPPIFQPPTLPEDPAKDNEKDENDFFSSDDGGIAEAEPGQDEGDEEKWLAPVEISDPNVHWNGLNLRLTVTESAVWCHNHKGDPEAASYLLDLPIEFPS